MAFLSLISEKFNKLNSEQEKKSFYLFVLLYTTNNFRVVKQLMNNKIGNYIKIIIPRPEPDFVFSQNLRNFNGSNSDT